MLMIRDATRAELQQVVDYAYRLNSMPAHRCKAFPSDYSSIREQFARMLKHRPDRLLVLEENNQIRGVLALLVEPQEKYLQAIGGVFAENDYDNAAKAFFDYAAINYRGFQLDAAYPAENKQAVRFMESRGAKLVDFEFEMRLKKDEFQVLCSVDNSIIQLTESYHESFLEFQDLHHPDVFWTGQKLLKALDKFRIHIVIEKEKVIGSVVTSRLTNEIYFFAVADRKQILGCGKALLLQAVRDAFDDGAEELLSMVEKDNLSKINLFEKLGFKKTDTCLTYTIRR